MPGPPDAPLPLVLSCEHGGNHVPARWQTLFRGAEAVLESHRGWDPGALRLARALARRLSAPLIATTVSRLLVEPNRSLGHRQLFSEFTKGLPRSERARILRRYWQAHRARVQGAVEDALRRYGRVLHVGVHSFTPVLHGEVRDVDVGVLYDPQRVRESSLCQAWIRDLRAALPDCRVRANAPYRGTSDGLTTYLRQPLGERYLGVELEVSQGLLARAGAAGRLTAAIGRTLEGRAGAAPSQRSETAARSSALRRSSSAARKRTTPTSG